MNGKDIPSRDIIKLLRQIGYQPKQQVRTIWRESLANMRSDVSELERLYNLKEKP